MGEDEGMLLKIIWIRLLRLVMSPEEVPHQEVGRGVMHPQLRGAQILDAVRLHKNGFPENLNYGEFWRRYRILSDELQKRQPTLTEMKASVEDLLADMDLDKSAFRLGNTQVFLRAG